jgi:hypothetical protein
MVPTEGGSGSASSMPYEEGMGQWLNMHALESILAIFTRPVHRESVLGSRPSPATSRAVPAAHFDVEKGDTLNKLAKLLISVAAVLFLFPGTALAQPVNDEFGSAVVVTEPLPFTHSVSTVDATPADYDPACGGGPTVWYTYTPSTSGSVAADTFGSDYDTTLWVGTGSPSSFSTIDCNDDAAGDLQSFVAWDAVAGTTYYMMVASCCGDPNSPGGNLVFNVGAPPPSPQLDISIDPVGTFDPSTGTATVSGVVDCSNGSSVQIFGTIRQRVGRAFVTGSFFVFLEGCSQDMTWTATITGDGVFAGGRASAEVFASTCGPIECAEDSQSRTIRLRGQGGG